ncbi:hypothetical protein [uncultured Selenomonas sp.]|uniref:hypothetical protein n=1 Tax=uncultured Selenomonas sp. TaxID=159275 RepID=UPI0025D72125|nr:hypothetical protein [uncultured Selenomonas sp.]
MMYPFLTLDDETEITHSEMLPDHRVKVYVEKPDENDGFHHMVCYLPSYDIMEVSGFTKKEVHRYLDIIRSTAHLMIEFSQEGGFENAANF